MTGGRPLGESAVGASLGPVEQTWDADDCLLYALGVGAGTGAPENFDLQWTTENSDGVRLQVLPTYAVVIAARNRAIYRELGEIDWTTVVHGEQHVELAQPLPVQGRVWLTTTITAVRDKGSGALVQLQTEAVDVSSGSTLFGTRSALFVKGAGGWGGDRGEATPPDIPDRAADASIVLPTRPDQALLYRLSGDRNPLHSDPAYARSAGFERPILHGLCTYGIAGRALITMLGNSDANSLRAMGARFSRPVLPGQDLTIQAWRTDGDNALFVARNADGELVLDRGYCRFDGRPPAAAS